MMPLATIRPFRRLAATVLTVLAVALAAPHSAVAATQRTFASAEAAAQALADALKTHDKQALLAVLGAEAQPLISSGDPVADQKVRNRFVKSYAEAHSLVSGHDGQTVLQIGTDDWPFPIPLVKSEAGWRFDAAAGKEEVLDRRIGANELSAIQACLAYVDAQREYYEANPENSSLLHYAQKLASTPGKRDGLYWDVKPDEEQSPLGPEFASARSEGYAAAGKGDPYHGYYFRILTAQGPAASGGAYDYLAQGQMMGGFGLIAYPAKWDNSGVMTFIVNHDGVVFQQDLGPDTLAAATAIKAFNPGDGWTPVEPESSVAPAAP